MICLTSGKSWDVHSIVRNKPILCIPPFPLLFSSFRILIIGLVKNIFVGPFCINFKISVKTTARAYKRYFDKIRNIPDREINEQDSGM